MPAVPERRALVAIWLVTAVLLSGLLAVGRLTRTSGDDPDPGRQRPGILDLGALPEPAPDVPGVDLRSGQAAVVFLAFLVGGTVALAAMAAWSYATRLPVRRPELWILAAHLYAMFPDFVFEAGHRHEWWMEVFLLHIRSHFVPGRNLFWLVTFLVALAAYLTVLDGRVRREAM